MIAGIGVDLADVTRFEKLLDRFGSRAVTKILAPVEIERFHRSALPAAYLAKRWAAKEAFGKALGTGIAKGLALPQIAIVSGDNGEPRFEFSGAAAALIKKRGIDCCHVTISDERLDSGAMLATAFVVLETSHSG